MDHQTGFPGLQVSQTHIKVNIFTLPCIKGGILPLNKCQATFHTDIRRLNRKSTFLHRHTIRGNTINESYITDNRLNNSQHHRQGQGTGCLLVSGSKSHQMLPDILHLRSPGELRNGWVALRDNLETGP